MVLLDRAEIQSASFSLSRPNLRDELWPSSSRAAFFTPGYRMPNDSIELDPAAADVVPHEVAEIGRRVAG